MSEVPLHYLAPRREAKVNFSEITSQVLHVLESLLLACIAHEIREIDFCKEARVFLREEPRCAQ